MKIFSFIRRRMAPLFEFWYWFLARPNSKEPDKSRNIQFAALFLLLALLSIATQSCFAQSVNGPLNFGNNFFVTGDYVVAGARLNEEESNGFATGTIKIPDANPGIRGAKSVPAGAQVVAALLYWQTVERSTTVPGQNGSGQNGFFRPVYQGGPLTAYPISGVNVTSQNPVPYRNDGCTGPSEGNVVRTYRADVRAYLPQDAKGDVIVNGLSNGITYGTYKVRLPRNEDGTPITLGATLVIIYRVLSPNVPLNAIVIYDGDFAPGSALTMTQKVQIFQAGKSPVSRLTHIVGNGDDDGYQTVYLNNTRLPSLYGSGQPAFPGYYGSWDNPTWAFPDPKYPAIGNPVTAGDALATTRVVPAGGNQGCVSWGAVIVSTTVQNSDNDGLLDVWKTKHGYCDASINEGVCSGVGDPAWVDLTGAVPGKQDVFVQLDYMCSIVTGTSVTSPGSCDTTNGYSFDPRLTADGTDAVQKVVTAFANKQINLHVIYTHAIKEEPCADVPGSPPALCPFPNQQGVVGWPGGFVFFENQLVDPSTGDLCLTSPPAPTCVPVFQHGKKDSYHHAFFAHALGLPSWTVQSGTLTSVVQTGNTVTFTTSTPHGLVNDPLGPSGRVTVAFAITNLNMNGTFNVTVTGQTSFTIKVANSTTATYTRFTDPNLAVASGQAGTISGFSDIGGAHSVIALGNWGTDGQSWQVKAGTFMHETGHSLGLTHGGLFLDNLQTTPNDYTPSIEPNCKSNHQSVMNYLFQVDLLDNGTLTNVPDYSGQTLSTLNESTAASSPFPNPTSYQSTSWYLPTVLGTPATQHCDGTALLSTDKRMSRVTGPTSSLFWSAGQDINFDGNGNESMRGHNDWSGTPTMPGIDLRQISATGTLSAPGLGGRLGGGGGLGGRLGGGGGVGGLLDGAGGLAGKLGGGGGLAGKLGGGGGLGGRLGGGGGVGELNRSTANSVTRPPRNLTASEEVSARFIDLSWAPPTFGQVGAYRIYRSADGGTTFTLIATVPGNQPSYRDTVTCKPTGYQYRVTAVLAGTFPTFPPGPTEGQESVPSNTVSTDVHSQKLLTGCYTNAPPAVSLSDLSFPANTQFVQGSSVPITWTLKDDDTGALVTNKNANTLLLFGPFPSDAGCPQSLPANTTGIMLLSQGTVTPQSGASTFSNNPPFTFNWDTTPFNAGCYFFQLNLDSGQSETTTSPLTLLIFVSDSAPHVTTTSLPNAIVGIPYSNTVMEAGGVSTFTWSIVSSTPSALPGLSLDSASGILSGTPTTPGDYTFMVKVTDSVGNFGTQTLMLHVAIPGGLVYVANNVATGTVSGYIIDATSGALTPVSGSPFAAGVSPVWVTVDPAARFAYAANLGSNISAYSIDAVTGALLPVSGSPFSSGAPSSVAVDPGGRFAYVTNSTAGTVSAYTINVTGALTAVAGSPFATGSQPASVAVDPSGQFAYVANTSSNNISAYNIDQTTGSLTAVASSPFLAGTSPFVIVVDPAAPFAYVANSVDNTVSAYSIDATTGALSSISGSPFPTGEGTTPHWVTVDPAGQFLYTANQNGSVSAFSINATTGALTAVSGSPFAAGSQSDSVAVDATSKFAYVANASSNNVSAYTIGTTGALTAVTGSPFNTGVSPASVATTTYACAAFPAGIVPFTTIFSIATDSAGDTFVVGGRPNGMMAAVQSVPLPSVSNERFCNPVTLETNYTVPAYVPTAAERVGDFSAYAGLTLIDPQTHQPFSNNMIPINELDSVFVWRIPPHSSNLTRLPCSLEPTLHSIEGTVPTSIQFANDTAGPVNVYWINYQGQRVFYRGGPFTALAAGQSYVQGTYITHPWIITDVATNKCLGIWLPTESLGTAVITGSAPLPAPPQPPTNLVAAVQPSGPTTAASVVLTWNASPSASAVGYNVYRGTASAGPFTKLTSTPTSNLTFTDGNVQSGTTYYYMTTAVDGSGNESAFSSQTPAMILTPPQPPSGLSEAVQQPGGPGTAASVVLSWNPSTSSVVGYNVYRATSSGAYTTKLATVSTPGFTDPTVSSGTTYYYVTTAVDGSGNESAFSNEVSAAIP